MVRSHSRPLRVVLAIVVSAGSGLAAPRQVPQVVKYLPVEHRPYDFAISPDGQFALAVTGTYVNPNNPGVGQPGKLYVFDLTSSVYAHQEYDIGLEVSEYTSDALDTVEDYGLALGSSSSSFSGGASLRLLLPLPPSGPLLDGSNFGADASCVIEASTGHPFAVVRAYAGQSAIWDLKTGAASLVGVVPPTYWDSTAPGWHYGDARRLSDAVQSTSTHTIAISNSSMPASLNGPPNHGFVGIASFDGQVNRSHSFTCTNLTPPGCQTPNWGAAVHDVAITPNGAYGVVSGNGFHGVFRMSGGEKIYDSLQANAGSRAVCFRTNPFNRITVDSVEVTNQRAVLIGTDGIEYDPGSTNVPPGCPAGSSVRDIAKWRITVLNLRSNPITQVTFIDPTASTIPCRTTRAHDVAITPNGAWAFITTRIGTCRIDLTTWPVSSPVFYPTPNDPLAHGGGDAFVSDSIVCTNTRAVAIGRVPAATPSLPAIAQVCIYDVGQAADAASVPIVLTLAAPSDIWLCPTDVVIDPSERYAFVRSRNVNPNVAQQFSFRQYGRVSVIDLQAGTLVVEFEGTALLPFGAAWGVDQIEASNQFVITGGENGQFLNPTPSEGWIQLLKF